MANGIDIGKISEEDFEKEDLDKQIPILYRGIMQTQADMKETKVTQQTILDTLQCQEKIFDKRYIKTSWLKTKVAIGTAFIYGIMFGTEHIIPIGKNVIDICKKIFHN